MARPILSDVRKSILSISSHVAFGHVGNSAAVPAMQALGLTVHAVPTVVLSNHPGHGPPAGLRIPARDLAAILDTLLALRVLDDLGGVMTGYFAANDQIFCAARLIRQLKDKNPALVYLCDPVLGDEDSKLYVPLPVAEAIKSSLLPLADVLTPNIFELEWLSGRPVASVDEVREASSRLDVKSIIATSVAKGRDRLSTMLTGTSGEASLETARRSHVPHGTGDLLAGLVLGYLVLGNDMPSALKSAMGRLEQVIEASLGAPALNLAEGFCKPENRMGQ